MEPRSFVYEEKAVDPLIARAALERLDHRALESMVAAGAACVLALAVAMVDAGIAVAAGLGGLVGILICVCARADRQALLARLCRQRSAYEIEAVRLAGDRFATPELRRRVSRTLGELVLEADGAAPATSPHAMLERVRQNRSDIIALAFHLARPEASIHPSAVLTLASALTDAPLSPLYNARIPQHQLRSMLLRAQAAVRD